MPDSEASEEWSRLAAPPASDQYFAVLFSPAGQRPLISAVFALETAWQQAAGSRGDDGVAHMKLAWWGEELGRLRDGEPRHPVTRALLQHAADAPRWALTLADGLTAYRQDRDGIAFPDIAALQRYAERSRGLFQRMIVAAGGEETESSTAFANALGSGIRLTEILRDLPQDIVNNRILLPLDELSAAGIGSAELKAGVMRDALAPLLQSLATRAEECFAEALKHAQDEPHSQQHCGLILAALHRRLLAQMARNDYLPATSIPALHPFRRLLVAWQTARRIPAS